MPAFVRVALCAGLLLACCTTADAPAPVVVTEGPPVSGPATPVLEIPPVDPRIQRADALFAPVTPDKPGQAVIVTQRGQTVYERYLCSANLEHGVRVTENNRFHVASVCKQFTAYAVHVLAQEGKCDLDADIRTWVPDMPAYSRPITPRQLLSHTSGVRDEWGLFLLGGNSFPDLMTQRATLALIRNQKAPNFEPGASYEYSNSGYTLLAAIVEKASGKTLRQFLDEQVFCPLGMTGMLVFDNPAELVLNRADSYSPAKGGGVRVSLHNYTPYGATNLNSTPRDMPKWLQELNHPRPLNAAAFEAMRQPGRLNDGTVPPYASGLSLVNVGERRTLQHTGSDAGYRAAVAAFPDDDVAIARFSNGSVSQGVGIDRLANIFLDDGAGAPARPAAPARADPPPLEALHRIAGSCTTDYAPGIELRVLDGMLQRVSGGVRRLRPSSPMAVSTSWAIPLSG